MLLQLNFLSQKGNGAMKTLTKLAVILGTSLTLAATASAQTNVEAADDFATSKICAAATKGSRMKLHKAMENAGYTKQFVVENVTCNDMPLVDFVEQYGSNVATVNHYITSGRYEPKDVVAKVAY